MPLTGHRSTLASVIAWAASALASLAQVPATDAIDARLQRFVDEERVVGLSFAAAVHAAPLAQIHKGWEDREAGIPASDATMYRWASISKPVTAIAAMQLWERGQLDLDADVRLLVPEFPDKGMSITVRQLLCHQGGIVHYSNGPVIRTEPPQGLEHPFKDVVIALTTFQASPLVSEPGEKYSYTTHGYMLVGAAIERGGGAPFAEQIRERICGPLGLTTLRPDYQWEKIEHRAVGYRRRGETVERSTDTDVSWKLAGGGFISTVGDLARFGEGLMGSDLVKPETRALMWTRQPNRAGEPTSYGLGFNVGTLGRRRAVSHSGSQEKAATYLLILPDDGMVVALMSNTEGTRLESLARELAESLLPQAPGVSRP